LDLFGKETVLGFFLDVYRLKCARFGKPLRSVRLESKRLTRSRTLTPSP